MKFTRVRINDFYNLKDVDLDLTEGNALIVGPNGSGKSNIIKCIDFLVNRILGRGSTNAQIWDVNSPNAFIEVDAVLRQAEVQFFSNLRVWYLLCHVCDIIAIIIAVLNNLVTHHELADSESTPTILVDKFHQESIFCDIPKERLRTLFEMGGFGPIRDGKVTLHRNSRHDIDWRNPCVKSLIHETLDNLFPKLLKITQETVASIKSRPKDGSDVSMWVRTANPGTQIDLHHSNNILGDAWLPAAREDEIKAIWSSLSEIFGDLKGLEVTFEGYDNDSNCLKSESLQSLISNLVNPGRFHSPHLSSGNTNQHRTWHVHRSPHDLHRYCAEIMQDAQPGIMRWLSRCLQGHSDAQKIISTEKRVFVDEMAKKFLESSLCILPQNRGLFGKGSTVSLDLNKVENMLIWSSLSTDGQQQKQYKSVVDALRSFCGLEICVRGNPSHQICQQNAEVIKSLGNDLAKPHCGSSLNVGERLRVLAEQVIQQSQLNNLQVLITRTIPYEDSPYRITTQLSDLSGGEIEILMVLCAVHLSGADTVLLHPPQQAQLRRWLETQRPKDQVCAAISHSTEFISLQTLGCLYHMSFTGRGFTSFKLVIRSHGVRLLGTKPESNNKVASDMGEEDGLVTPQSSVTAAKQVNFEKEVLTMLMRPTMRKLFFATGVYFVEGETDERVLTAMRHCMMAEASNVSEAITSGEEDNIFERLKRAKQVMKVREMDQWEILPLYGCGEAVKAYKIAKELKIPCAVILDADAITVKHKVIQPINANWKKSVLFIQLSKVAGALPDAKALLKDVEKVLDKGEGQVRETFANNGFWIWERDVEQALVDNYEARRKLHEMTTRFRIRSNPPNDRGTLGSQEDTERPSGSKRKEPHQSYSTKEPSNKRIKSIQSQQQANSDGASQMGATNTTESQRISADQVRKYLHDKGGWKKISWETLLDVINICLKDEGNPFAHFYKFMLQWQSKAKKTKTELPRDLLNKILANYID